MNDGLWLRSALEWMVEVFDDNALVAWSILSGPFIAALAFVYRTRRYIGWAKDHFGIIVAMRSALGQFLRFDHAAYVPSKSASLLRW